MGLIPDRAAFDAIEPEVRNQGFTVLGGEAERIADAVREGYSDGMALAAAVALGARSLANSGENLGASQLEVALLDRERPRRAFRRIKGDELEALLG